MTTLLTVLIVLIALGLFIWIAERAPFQQPIRWAIMAISVVVAIVFLLGRIGVFNG